MKDYFSFIKMLLYNHKYFILIFSMLVGTYAVVFWYTYNILQENQNNHVDQILDQYKTSYIESEGNILQYINNILSIQDFIFVNQSNIITQKQYQNITRFDLNPFKNIFENFRYSPVVYNRTQYDNYAKQYIDPNFFIKNSFDFEVSDPYFLNEVPFYIPIAYSNPEFVSPSGYGFDLHNFTDTRETFFNNFLCVDDHVIGNTLSFFNSVDNNDLGFYIGKISSSNCTTQCANTFNNLIIQNNQCILGFNYVAMLQRVFIDGIIADLKRNIVIDVGDVTFEVYDSRSSHLVSRSLKVNNNPSETLSLNIFQSTSSAFRSGDNINYRINIYFDADIYDESIDDQISITIIVFVVFTVVSIIVVSIIYYLIQKTLVINQQKTDDVRELSNYVNHELRNPLNIISAVAQIIYLRLEKNIKGEAPIDIKIIHSDIGTIINSTRMVSLVVNDVLDMQRLEEDKLVIEKSNFCVEELFNMFEKSITHIKDEISSSINTVIKYDDNLQLCTDKNRLLQILVNIYTNSAKYSKEGTITISATQNKAHIIFSVHDNGVGMDDEILQNIFKNVIYKRKNNTMNSVGLGLYICGLLCKKLGIEFKCESEINNGTTITLFMKT